MNRHKVKLVIGPTSCLLSIPCASHGIENFLQIYGHSKFLLFSLFQRVLFCLLRSYFRGNKESLCHQNNVVSFSPTSPTIVSKFTPSRHAAIVVITNVILAISIFLVGRFSFGSKALLSYIFIIQELLEKKLMEAVLVNLIKHLRQEPSGLVYHRWCYKTHFTNTNRHVTPPFKIIGYFDLYRFINLQCIEKHTKHFRTEGVVPRHGNNPSTAIKLNPFRPPICRTRRIHQTVAVAIAKTTCRMYYYCRDS